jgi:hypothetical protein
VGVTGRLPDWEAGTIPRPLRAVYGFLDDTLCLLSCLGYRPAWYREWWQRGS